MLNRLALKSGATNRFEVLQLVRDGFTNQSEAALECEFSRSDDTGSRSKMNGY